jgi:hypothetical protein
VRPFTSTPRLLTMVFDQQASDDASTGVRIVCDLYPRRSIG